MGVRNSLGIFQDILNKIYSEFEFIWTYTDDLLKTTKGDWSNNLEELELTLQNLKYNGLKCNIKKSLFEKTEKEYLGFWVTKTGTQPINKKVEAIVKLKPPNKSKEVRVFIGIVNSYMDMWDKRSHLLHTLTAITPNQVKFKWTDME